MEVEGAQVPADHVGSTAAAANVEPPNFIDNRRREERKSGYVGPWDSADMAHRQHVAEGRTGYFASGDGYQRDEYVKLASGLANRLAECLNYDVAQALRGMPFVQTCVTITAPMKEAGIYSRFIGQKHQPLCGPRKACGRVV